MRQTLKCFALLCFWTPLKNFEKRLLFSSSLRLSVRMKETFEIFNGGFYIIYPEILSLLKKDKSKRQTYVH